MKFKQILTSLVENKHADTLARKEAVDVYNTVYKLLKKLAKTSDNLYQDMQNDNDFWKVILYDKRLAPKKMESATDFGHSPIFINRLANMDYIKVELDRFYSKADGLSIRFEKRVTDKSATYNYKNDTITMYCISPYIDMSSDRDFLLAIETLPRYFKAAKSSFIHEYIHRLDIHRMSRDYTPMSGEYHKNKQFSKYSNDPLEFNAYYQQGIQALWDIFNDAKSRDIGMIPEYFKQKYWSNPSTEPLAKNFQLFIDLFVYPKKAWRNSRTHLGKNHLYPFEPEFIQLLSKDRLKRLYKRIYPEYQEMIRKGLWQTGNDDTFATPYDENDPYIDQRRF